MALAVRLLVVLPLALQLLEALQIRHTKLIHANRHLHNVRDELQSIDANVVGAQFVLVAVFVQVRARPHPSLGDLLVAVSHRPRFVHAPAAERLLAEALTA